MFWTAFNFIIDVFAQIVNFFFFVDLGGVNMAMFIGGAFVFGVALKVFGILMGSYNGDSLIVSKESKRAIAREYRKGHK